MVSLNREFFGRHLSVRRRFLFAAFLVFFLSLTAIFAVKKSTAFSTDSAISFEVADAGLRLYLEKYQGASQGASLGTLGTCSGGVFSGDYFTIGKYEVTFYGSGDQKLGCGSKLASVVVVRSISFYRGMSMVVQRQVRADDGSVQSPMPTPTPNPIPTPTPTPVPTPTPTPTPPSLRDVSYKGGLLLDVYPAANGNTNAPVLLFLHSGGWYKGDKTDDAARLGASLSALGITVIAPNYTLVPSGYYPTPLLDTDCARRWIVANASAYGFDVNRISLGGYSSGAHIALLYGLRPSAYQDTSCPWSASSPSLKNIVALAGPTNLATITGDVRTMANNFLNGASAVEASPITYAGNRNSSRFLLLQTQDDELVSFGGQAEPFYSALLASNPSTVQAKWYASGGHLFAYSVGTATYRDVVNRIQAFLAP